MMYCGESCYCVLFCFILFWGFQMKMNELEHGYFRSVPGFAFGRKKILNDLITWPLHANLSGLGLSGYQTPS